MKSILTIPCDPTKEVRVREAAKEPPLQELQDLVDGYIEIVPQWSRHFGQRCIAYCNEEGKLRGLPMNHRATAFWWAALGQRVDDVLVGDIVLVVNQ